MPDRRRIAVLTTGRQDYGILRSTLHLLAAAPDFELSLWVGGMHLCERFGRTVDLIRADGFEPTRELPFIMEPPDVIHDSARAVETIALALAEDRPEMLLVLGDRTETLAAGFAATLTSVPIIHVHGGEETEGAIDNVCRHALTKLSHLHLVSHPLHAQRVLQMGEDVSTVKVVGAPGLDNLYRSDLPGRAQLEQRLGRSLEDPIVLVTVQPTTLEGDPCVEVRAVAEALTRVPGTYVITQPNADRGGAEIRTFWSEWTADERRGNMILVDALGESWYWGILRIAKAVVGNSSSGIIEAPAVGVPVINIGDRQRGRLRYGVVADVPPSATAIEDALRRALAGELIPTVLSAESYPMGPAAPRILDALRCWHPVLGLRKPFVLSAERVC